MGDERLARVGGMERRVLSCAMRYSIVFRRPSDAQLTQLFTHYATLVVSFSLHCMRERELSVFIGVNKRFYL